MTGLWRALTGRGAATDPRAEDRRLRGRSYAIPFERVWNATLALADGGLRRWRVVSADDREGVAIAEATTLLLRRIDEVRIDVGLDADGQTRVDVSAHARAGWTDLGRNARRIGRFVRSLDRALDARPGVILDPSRSADREG